MINSILFILIYLSVVFPGISMADTIMTETFESGDLFTTNADGFTWGGTNRTSIVTMEPDCGGLTSGNATVIFNGSSICNGPISGRDWTAKTGKNSLRFRYATGQSMTEQRFNLGTHYPDVWFRYMIRVPVNFTQGSQNNKFLALWVDNYDSLGDVTWQTRPNGAGGANLVFQDGGVAHGEEDPTAFITVPGDRGRWMEVIAHVQTATTSSSSDGVIQLWRRWDGDEYYTKIHEKLNARVYEAGASIQGIAHGYLFGWANEPYDVDTEWLVDDFSIYDSLDTPVAGKQPKPVTSLTVD